MLEKAITDYLRRYFDEDLNKSQHQEQIKQKNIPRLRIFKGCCGAISVSKRRLKFKPR